MSDESKEIARLRERVSELEVELMASRRSAEPGRTAELRLRSLFEQASDPVFCYECDPPFSVDLPVAEQVERLYDCVLIECNDACAQAYGADTAAEVIGRRLTELFGTRSGSLDRLFEQTVRHGYRTIDGEGVEVLPDGSKRYFLNNAHGVIEEGRLQRIWGTFRDITDRKAVEEALGAERDLTEAAWDAQRDTLFLFDPSTDRALRWNRAFREISGYSDEEIAELPAPGSYYGSEDLARAAALIESLAEDEAGAIELDLICKDGRRVPTEYVASVVADEAGSPRYLMSIGRDISERKRAEAEVRRHRERLVRFMDSATDSFHLVDPSLCIIEVSESAVRVLREANSEITSRQDLVGRDLLEVYPFMRGEGAEERFRRVLRTGKPVLFDDVVEHPQSGQVYLTVRAFKVGDDLGIIATDISERKRAEEEQAALERQVQHTQKLESLGILAGGIAHDFNNLLVGVLGGTELAMQHLSADSLARPLLDDVAKATHRAADLAKQMLAYSGRGRFVVEPTDLSVLVREMFNLLEASVPKKIRLVYELAEDLPATEIDVTQIRQILLNLVINAAEAIGDDVGTISVTTGFVECGRKELAEMYLGDEAKLGECVYLRVSDSGSGMDEETRNRIFDPFFTTKSTGRGLGLAAALGIVRGHGGAIKVKSAVGAGTRMTVVFPATPEAAVRPIEDSVSNGAWTGSGTVLLVDDEEVVRSVGAAMLRRLGFEVLVAEDGRQGVEAFRRQADEIALVVLDLAMPEMNGAEVFQELQRIKSDVKVLLSSGFNEQDITKQFAVTELAGFVQKPYRLETLSGKVREILGS